MPRPKTRTNDEILEATHRVILERGPHGLTLAHVAEAVGLSPATLLQRFESKQGLILAFARWSAARTGALVERDGAGGLSSIRAALLRFAEELDDRDRFANSMALLFEDVRDPELRAIAGGHAEAREKAIAAGLRVAQRRGELAPCDADALARVV
jgi:AcrR family transcriptional regulator